MVRSTEAHHGSPSHHNSLGFFQKVQEGQSPVVHKAGLDPQHRCSDRYTQIPPSLPQGFRSQTRNKRTQGLNKSSLLLKFNTLN